MLSLQWSPYIFKRPRQVRRVACGALGRVKGGAGDLVKGGAGDLVKALRDAEARRSDHPRSWMFDIYNIYPLVNVYRKLLKITIYSEFSHKGWIFPYR